MSLADVITKSADRLRTIVPSVLTSVYEHPPQAPVPNGKLPAVFQRPDTGTVDYGSDLRIMTHRYHVIGLVARTEDLPQDYSAAMPLLEPLIAVFEADTSFGTTTYYGAQVIDYDIGPVTYMDAHYVAIALTVEIKEKTPVSMA
jgi:hypothetical protein